MDITSHTAPIRQAGSLPPTKNDNLDESASISKFICNVLILILNCTSLATEYILERERELYIAKVILVFLDL